ncbi:MAG: hypothetical protein BGO54_22850 [Sphingobacteriales bacterium 46-32]|jgi:hypothetical protein|nr:MAG: hypothetical protein BGO54_22850 [Sphingobacteriales bacterium 46-32]
MPGSIDLIAQISIKPARRQNSFSLKGKIFKKIFKNGNTTKDLENSLIQLHLRKIWGILPRFLPDSLILIIKP